MGSEVFAYSGPKHMMARIGTAASSATVIKINWDSDEHRRCVAACIVNGTYIMESDEYRVNSGKPLAPAWWESFGFRRIQTLRYECECVFCKTKTKLFTLGSHRPWSIYGAILEHVPPAGGARRHPSAPRYVVAFRGTMPRHPSYLGDMHLNLRILVNKQHACGRFSHARDEVAKLLNSIAGNNGRGGGAAAVWLAGHSLGASIALDVGRAMVSRKERWNLPAFLFNPPQVSLAPSMLPPALRRVAKRVVYPASYVAKAALGATVLRPHERDMEAVFETLAPWVPELYVHERDFICRGFIDYFEQRQKMLSRLRPVAEVAMKLSIRDMLICIHSADTAAEDGEDHQRVRPHLLPSARLWKNSSYHEEHGILQWWKPDGELRLSSRRYSDRGAEAELFYG